MVRRCVPSLHSVRWLDLALCAALFVLLLLASGPAAAAASAYTESPMLAARVAAGELPPVEDRLPDVPFVVGPGVLISEEHLEWQPGRYGGDLRSPHFPGGGGEMWAFGREPFLQAPRVGIDPITGSVVESFEVSEDNRVFTFYMRRGMRWSDGHPVTSEDVRFTYEDLWLHPEISPVFPAHFRTGGSPDGEPMQLTILDDFTFKIEFDEPYGMFLAGMAIVGWRGYTELVNPSHYLKQYHADYTPLNDMRAELDEQELGDEWWNLLNARRAEPTPVKRSAFGSPGLWPWMFAEESDGVIVYERNPYYFKVDVEGQQLPYIDRVVSYEVSDHEMIMMKTIAGEFDALFADVRLRELPMLVQNEERGGYRTMVPHMHTVPVVIYPNHTYEGTAWQEVIHDIRFRQALSMAIDRSEMIDTLYYRQANFPDPQVVPEEFSTFNPERAEQLLDELGMTGRDSDGYRLSPNGEPFELFFQVWNRRPDMVPATELYVEYFQAIGLRTSMRPVSGSLRAQLEGANELQIDVEYHHLPMMRLGWASMEILPDAWMANYGTRWANWYTTDGREGIEPPDWVQEAHAIHRRVNQAIPGSDTAAAAWEDAFSWIRTNMPYIIVVDRVSHPFIVSANMRNVPETGFNIASSFAVEQFFFAE